MIVDRAVYVDGKRLADGDEPPAGSEHFTWVGLAEPTSEELSSVAEEFDLHPLAVEDAVKAHQRPKIEHYGDSWFMVLKTVHPIGRRELDVGEVMAFVGDRFVVTVRHGPAVTVGQVRKKLESDPARLARGPWEVLHSLADDVVDEYEVVLRGMEDEISAVQAAVFEAPTSAHTGQIFHMKREVLEFRQAVSPLCEALDLLSTWEKSPIPHDRRAYFRDVHDHTKRVDDRLHTMDDLMSSALSVNVAQVGMRQNEDMRKISAWVAIVAVPTMVAGLYGMNFDHMPELRWRYSYPVVVVVTVGVCYALFRNFKRRGWL